MRKFRNRLDQFGDVLTVPEAACVLRIGRNSAYEAARRGELPTIAIGRRLLVPKDALVRMLTTGYPKAPTPTESADPTRTRPRQAF